MRNKLNVLLIAGIALLFSCKKDAVPNASPDVNDPFIRYDNPSSDLDHQIYQFYTQSGIPVLYSDTLTKSPLVKLNVGYHLTGIDSLIAIRLLKNNADKLTGLSFIKDQVMPALGSGLRPYSILMVDSVFSYKINYPNIRVKQPPVSTYLGLNTLVIGKIATIKNMIPDSVKTYKRDIFKSILSVNLNQRPDLLKAFQAVSAAYYGKYAYGTDFTSSYVPFAAEEAYGILAPNGITPPYGYSVPDQTTDLNAYLNVVLLLSSSEFAAKYSNYPLVMAKYTILTKAIIALGFKGLS